MVSFDSREQVGHSTTLNRASSVDQEMRNGNCSTIIIVGIESPVADVFTKKSGMGMNGTECRKIDSHGEAITRRSPPCWTISLANLATTEETPKFSDIRIYVSYLLK